MTPLAFASRDAGPALRGAPNFRDIGGCATRSGLHLRHGRVFRSGHLGQLDAGDIALLHERLGRQVCVVDLRGTSERASAACALPGATVQSLPVEPTVARKLEALAAAGEPLTAEAARRFMGEAYEGFARHAGPRLAAFLAHLAATPGQPTVLHCAAGKDRTGFVTAMLLEALDVPRATIVEDYLHTNTRLAAREGGRFPPEVMRVLATVDAAFLDAAYGVIDREFGGVDRYLLQAGGLSPDARERLRAQLVA